MADLLPRTLAAVVGLALLLTMAIGLEDLTGTPGGRGVAAREVLQLVVLSAAWLLVNSPVEGRVLWAPVTGHGLTQADVLVVPPLVVAAGLALLRLRV